MDTGADLTVIPQSLILGLRLSPRGHVLSKSFDGTLSHRPVYYLRIIFEGHIVPSVRCITADRENVLLGRNVLNRFTITLDGKMLWFEMIPVSQR